jgi:hypothetical protein
MGALAGIVQVVFAIPFAAVLTAATAAPGVALLAHFAGFCLGVAAGRGRVLHAGTPET